VPELAQERGDHPSGFQVRPSMLRMFWRIMSILTQSSRSRGSRASLPEIVARTSRPRHIAGPENLGLVGCAVDQVMTARKLTA